MIDIVEHGADLADSLRDAQILITGATGWFGTWLLDALVALDRRYALRLTIVAVSRVPDDFVRRYPAFGDTRAIEWIVGDVIHALSIAGRRFTHVIHAAADSHPGVVDREATFDTIVDGTRNVLRIAAAHRGCRFLFVSSGAVYGRQPDHLAQLPESHAPSPDALDQDDIYAVAKREAERIVLAAVGDARVDAVIARCFAFVGPHMPFDAHFAIGNFIRDALRADAIEVRGRGESERSYLYMSDLVIWLLAALVRGVPGRAYNIGSGESVSIASLAARCVEISGHSKPVHVLGRAENERNYVPDITRAMEELGVRVTVPLNDAIERTMRWKRGQSERSASPTRVGAGARR